MALLTVGTAIADAPVFVLDQTQLPFDLGPGAPHNGPARPGNLPSAPANSAANAANMSSTYANSGRNPANSKRVLFDADGAVLGHYAANDSGTLNLFDLQGRRVAYRPRHSKSLFTNQGEWCGTVAQSQDGGLAFGVTRRCGRAIFR